MGMCTGVYSPATITQSLDCCSPDKLFLPIFRLLLISFIHTISAHSTCILNLISVAKTSLQLLILEGRLMGRLTSWVFRVKVVTIERWSSWISAVGVYSSSSMRRSHLNVRCWNWKISLVSHILAVVVVIICTGLRRRKDFLPWQSYFLNLPLLHLNLHRRLI